MVSKAFYTSKGFWGSAMVLVAFLAQMFGIDFNAEMQGQASELIVAVVTGVGGLVGLIGRILAKELLSIA